MTVSNSTTGIDFMVSVTMAVAWFCTLLTLSKLDLAVPLPHVVMPFSSTGLSLLVYDTQAQVCLC